MIKAVQQSVDVLGDREPRDEPAVREPDESAASRRRRPSMREGLQVLAGTPENRIKELLDGLQDRAARAAVCSQATNQLACILH